MKHFLGIDSGGSTTRACVIDAHGEVIFRGLSGPANLASTPEIEIIRHLGEAVQGMPNVDACAACFAGLLSESDRHRALALMERVIGDVPCAALPDYHATLAADPEADVVLISGTGALVASRRADRTVVKSGGGGPLLGDQGSAFDLGRRALQRTLLQANPMESSPFFEQTAIELFGTREPNQVIAAIYRAPSPAARIAQLAPTIVFDAQRGIEYATQSLEEVLISLVRALTEHLSAFIDKSGPVNVRVAGGLWEIDDQLFEQFVRLFETQSPRSVEVLIGRLTKESVLGAAHLAQKLFPQSTE